MAGNLCIMAVYYGSTPFLIAAWEEELKKEKAGLSDPEAITVAAFRACCHAKI